MLNSKVRAVIKKVDLNKIVLTKINTRTCPLIAKQTQVKTERIERRKWARADDKVATSESKKQAVIAQLFIN